MESGRKGGERAQITEKESQITEGGKGEMTERD